MEYVNFEKNYNPEAITDYYACGLQTGRGSNPKVKDLILKAKQHLSAIGWSFYYVDKSTGRRELRYHSPAGKNYISLRTACQDLIKHQANFNHTVEVGSSEVQEVKETEAKSEKKVECSSSNRPEKKIRIQDVESSFVSNEDSGIDVNDNIEGKKIQDLQRTMESSQPTKNVTEFKPKKRKRCVLSLLIEKNIVSLGSKIEYRNKRDEVLAKGKIYDDGIQCDCCNEFFLLSKFEAHAGSTYHRPAANLFVDDGRSLIDCQNELQHESSTKSPRVMIINDDFCSFCNDGGELLCCDSCTSSFHSTCIGLNAIPDSAYWSCPSCCCRLCHQGDEISKSSIKCRQCNLKFHIDCIKKLGFSIDAANWFCSENCEQIHLGLIMICGKAMPLTNHNLSWSLLKPDTETNCSKLKIALEVMHECFQPIKHRWSEKDLIKDVIFNNPMSTTSPNLKGFFTAVLEKDNEIITVVTVRIHGYKAAEIPLIATRFRYRRMGMCRILMDEIERKLGDLEVKRIVLPAVPEMISTWTESFGYSVMMEKERLDLVDCKFLGFPGTIICHKNLKEM